MSDPSNAERQARHRAKQREYVQGLEAEVTRLRAEVARLCTGTPPTDDEAEDGVLAAVAKVVNDEVRAELEAIEAAVIDDEAEAHNTEDDDSYETEDAERAELLALIGQLTDKLKEQYKIVDHLMERTKHHRNLVETHMQAIVHDMFEQARRKEKKRFKGFTNQEVLLKINPWATAEQLDEAAKD